MSRRRRWMNGWLVDEEWLDGGAIGREGEERAMVGGGWIEGG